VRDALVGRVERPLQAARAGGRRAGRGAWSRPGRGRRDVAERSGSAMAPSQPYRVELRLVRVQLRPSTVTAGRGRGHVTRVNLHGRNVHLDRRTLAAEQRRGSTWRARPRGKWPLRTGSITAYRSAAAQRREGRGGGGIGSERGRPGRRGRWRWTAARTPRPSGRRPRAASTWACPAGRIRPCGQEPADLLHVHLGPRAARPAGAVPLPERHVVEAAALPVDPAEAQGAVEGLADREARQARALLGDPQPRLWRGVWCRSSQASHAARRAGRGRRRGRATT
jgi:hypothetical protein